MIERDEQQLQRWVAGNWTHEEDGFLRQRAESGIDRTTAEKQLVVDGYIAAKFGIPLEAASRGREHYRGMWLGEGATDDQALEEVRVQTGMVDLFEKRQAGADKAAALAKKESGWWAGADRAQARSIRAFSEFTAGGGRGALQVSPDVLKYSPLGFVAGERARNAGAIGVNQLLGTIASGGFDLLAFSENLIGAPESGRAFEEHANAIRENFAPTAEQQAKVDESRGSFLKGPEAVGMYAGQGAGYVLPFFLGGAGVGKGLAGLGVKSGVVRMALAGGAMGAVEAASESGMALGDAGELLDAREKQFAEKVHELESMDPGERWEKFGKAGELALIEYRMSLADSRDPELAGRWAMNVFKQNVARSAVSGAVEMALGGKAVKGGLSMIGKGMPRTMGAIVGGGAFVGGMWSESEEELFQNAVQQNNMLAMDAELQGQFRNAPMAAARIAELNLWPTKVIHALANAGEDPDAIDTIFAASIISAKSTLVAAHSEMMEVKTLAQAERTRAMLREGLQAKAAAGDVSAAVALQELDAHGATAGTVAGVGQFVRNLQGAAKKIVSRTHDRVAAGETEFNPDDAFSEGVLEQTAGTMADEVAAHADAMAADDAVAEVPEMGTAAAPAAEPEPSAPDTVSPVQAVIDELNTQHPDAASMTVVSARDLPNGGMVEGKPVKAWYQDGKTYIVAERNTLAEVLAHWVHEQAHNGAALMKQANPAGWEWLEASVRESLSAEQLATGVLASGRKATDGAAVSIGVEEHLSTLAEKVAAGGKLSAGETKTWSGLRGMVRSWYVGLARKVGVAVRLTDAEVDAIAVELFRKGAGEKATAAKPGRIERAKAGPGRTVPTPVLDFIEEHGGIVPAGRRTDAGGEYDGQPSMRELGGLGSRLFASEGRGTTPDEMAMWMRDAGMITDALPDSIWQAVRGEAEYYRNAQRQEAADAEEERQAVAFHNDFVATPSRGGKKSFAVNVDTLKVGDVLVSRSGDDVPVVGIDADTLAVTLDGGTKYGEQTVDAGTVLNVAEIDHGGAGKALAGDDLRFKLGDSLLAPNGQPSKLNARQHAQVRTPEFIKWFGDWESDPANASKVVDENGEPLVVYHGTGADFTEFDTIGGNDFGAHFGTVGQANRFASREGGRVVTTFLNIRNPLTLPDLGRWSGSSNGALQAALTSVGIKVQPAPLKIASSDLWENLQRQEESNRKEIALALHTAGYDGILYANQHEGNGNSFVSISPTQIKSATANTGAFDGTNPDIRYKLGEWRGEWPQEFPNVTVQTSASKVIQHPDHKAAKAGDWQAAERLVADCIKPDKLLAMATAHPDAVIVACHAEEADGRNAIPQKFADAFGRIAGLPVDKKIVQAGFAGRTGSDMEYRMAIRPTFAGPVEAGREYILVDDVVTGGGTLVELRAYIESQGGKVVNVTTLGAAQFSTNFSMKKATADKLSAKFGVDYLYDFCKKFNLAQGNWRGLSEAEARWLYSSASLDTAGNRIFARRQSELSESGTVGESGQGASGEVSGNQASRGLTQPRLPLTGDGSGKSVAPEPKSPPGWLPGIKFKLGEPDAPAKLSRKAEAVATATAYEFGRTGKMPTERAVRRRLEAVGDKAEAAQVLQRAAILAHDAQLRLGEHANDESILRELVTAQLKELYRGHVTKAYGEGDAARMEYEKAVKRLTDWAGGTATQTALKAQPLTAAELTGGGVVNVEAFFSKIAPPVEEAVPAPAQADETQRRGGPTKEEDEAQATADLAALPLPTAAAPLKLEAIQDLQRGILDALRQRWAGKAQTRGPVEADPVFRAEYRATLVDLLGRAAYANVPAGARRERVMLRLKDFSNSPVPSIETANRIASQLAGAIAKARTTASKRTILAKIDRVLARASAPLSGSAVTELIKKRYHPENVAWLQLVDAVRGATDAEIEHAEARLAELVNANVDHTDKEERRKALAIVGKLLEGNATNPAPLAKLLRKNAVLAAMDGDALAKLALRAFALYGNLSGRTLADVQAAHDALLADLNLAKSRVEVAIGDRVKRLAGDTDRAFEGVKKHAGDASQDGWWTKTARSFELGTLDFAQFISRMTNDSALGDKLGQKAQAANDRKRIIMLREMVAFEKFAKELFGRDAQEVFKELSRPREEYRKFSRPKDDAPSQALSKANLMYIWLAWEQEKYRENMTTFGRDADVAGILQALSPQDLALARYMRDYFERTRPELSALSERVSGVPIVSPDPNYFPGKVDRQETGAAEAHYGLTLLPGSFNSRVPHGRDIDERTDALAIFRQRLEENAHVLGFAEFAGDLRHIFGNGAFRRNVAARLGKEVDTRFTQHWTEVAADRAKGMDASGAAADVVRKLNHYHTLAQLSYSLNALKQISGVAGFMLKTDAGEFGKAIAMPFTSLAAWQEATQELKGSDFWQVWTAGGMVDAIADAMSHTGTSKFDRAWAAGMVFQKIGIEGAAIVAAPGIYASKKAELMRNGWAESAAKTEALAHTSYIVNKTQGSSALHTRNSMSRNHATYRLLMKFQGPTVQLLGYEVEALSDLVRNGYKADGKRLAKVLLVNHVLVPGLMSAASMLVSAILGDYAGDDGEEEWFKDLKMAAVACLMGPLSAVVFVGEAAEVTIKKAMGLPIWGGIGNVSALRWYGDVGQAVIELANDKGGGVDEVFEDALKLSGKVFKPAAQGAKAAENWAED